ncbi:hypothetical protein [Phenylobacterium kunshanense]|nr:hypothetical protein [Phenylobacterium kunshanense]
MRGPNSAFAVAAALLASCNSTASSQQYRAHGEPSPGAAFSTPDEAVNAAVEMVCRPYLTGEATPARGKALAEAAGFRPASRSEALEGIGEDYVAMIAPLVRARVTIDFGFDTGAGEDCGVAVMDAAPAFDSYVQKLLTSGWKPAGPPILSGAERTEWMWAPDGSATLVATRLIDMSRVSPGRVLALYLTRGAQPIPPKCGPDQEPPCRNY